MCFLARAGHSCPCAMQILHKCAVRGLFPYIFWIITLCKLKNKFCFSQNCSVDSLIVFSYFSPSTVCDVLPLIINNHDVRLPANLLYKYLNKAAEFYINYVTRSTQIESQHQGKWKYPAVLFTETLVSCRLKNPSAIWLFFGYTPVWQCF